MDAPPVPRARPAWLEGALAGHRASLARAITAVEDNTVDAESVLQSIYPKIGRALVVGFTGSPGSGKSTLVAACIAEARRRALKVGVVAIDPSSPITGGAVLGDRIRMLAIASDDGVYVRSLAARGHLGGLSIAASRVVDVLDAAGKDLIIIETVGVGQSETAVSDLAHLTVLVCAPGMGDDVQMIKAGVLETADVFAVNKSDLPEAQGVMRQLQAAAHLAGGAPPAVVATIATSGAGVAELLDVLDRARSSKVLPPGEERLRRLRKTLETMAIEALQRRMKMRESREIDRLCESVLAGHCDFGTAVDELLDKSRGEATLPR